MLEVLIMSILGAAALGSQQPDPEEAGSEAMARILLGLDLVVKFEYDDHGQVFKSVRGLGQTFKLWQLRELDAQCLMHEARKAAGWYSAAGDEIFPDGSELDDGMKVIVEIIGRIGITSDEMNDVYTYDIVLTVPQEARWMPDQ